MSESGYQELDLDNPGKAAAAEQESDIEIVEEIEEPSTPEPSPEPKASEPSSATSSEEDDPDEDDSSPETPSERKKLTRSQRLKNQRDAYAKQLLETQARLQDAENRARRYESDANEGAAIGFDLYIKNLDTAMQALRRDFDVAFDSGDREKIFEVQQKMAIITAERAQVERDKRAVAPRVQPQQQQQQPAPQAQAPQPRRQPSPAAVEWYERNKDWFGKDAVMTSGAKAVDQQMVADGYSPTDPDYFEELDKRLRREFPHKLGGKSATPARQSANNPTIQNRSAPASVSGKLRVTITQADREEARKLGISIEDYAREKAKVERAQNTPSQYTEIF